MDDNLKNQIIELKRRLDSIETKYLAYEDFVINKMLVKLSKFFIYSISISLLSLAITPLLQPIIYGILIKFCSPGVVNQVKEIIIAIKGNA